MEENAEYSIPLRDQPNGIHSFSFDCGDDIFAHVEDPLASHCRLQVRVEARRTDEMLTLDFDIRGTVEQQCALCLEPMDYPIEDCGERIVVRLGSAWREEDDDLYEVDAASETLDLSQWIYEQVCVCLPIRCEHPLDDDGVPTCDPAMLAEVDKYVVRDEDDVERRAREAQGGATDPRWDALKALGGMADGR